MELLTVDDMAKPTRTLTGDSLVISDKKNPSELQTCISKENNLYFDSDGDQITKQPDIGSLVQLQTMR